MTVTDIAAGAAKTKAPAKKRAPKKLDGFGLVADRKELVDALAGASRALASSTAVPVLTGLRLELKGDDLVVSATDLDLHLSVEIEVHGRGDGTVIASGRLLEKLARAAGGELIELVAKKPLRGQPARLQLTAGQFVAHVGMMNVDDWPSLPVVTGNVVSIDGAEFAKAVRRTAFAASKDTARPILTGVSFEPDDEGMTLAATDSYRLAATKIADQLTTLPVIIPVRALAEVIGRGFGDEDSIEVKIDESQAQFSSNGRTVTTRLIEGEFPSWRRLVPEETAISIVTKRVDLMDAIGRVRLMAPKDPAIVRLRSTEPGLDVEASASDIGEATERLESEMVGEPIEVAFNAEYLVSALRVGADDSVLLKLTGAQGVATVTEEDWTVLLMPVKVGDDAQEPVGDDLAPDLEDEEDEDADGDDADGEDSDEE